MKAKKTGFWERLKKRIKKIAMAISYTVIMLPINLTLMFCEMAGDIRNIFCEA